MHGFIHQKTTRDKVIDRIVDIVIYASFLSVIVWAILKGFGVINTPALIQQLPLITGTVGLLGVAYKIGRFVEYVEQRFVQTELRFNHVDKDVEQLKKDMDFVKQRV